MLSMPGVINSILISISGNRVIADAIKKTQPADRVNLYMLIPLLIVIILSILGIFAPEILIHVSKRLYHVLSVPRRALTGIAKKINSKSTGDNALDESIKTAGYSYDPRQDIFYSNLDAWQKEAGYCRLYDEAAAPMGMIIDCEPIYFEYDNKRWMIELWKGQYDLTTGCEVGIYNTKDQDIYVPGTFFGTFYYCADEMDQLHISYILKKNGKPLFSRRGRHWWLTGFKLGEYSDPSELTMNVYITLKNRIMRDAFLSGLKKAGYLDKEITVRMNTVGLRFDKPRTEQPYTRGTETDKLIQKKNKYMCDRYQEITGPYDNFPDKMKALKNHAPDLYNIILKLGKTKDLFSGFEKIKKYL